MNFINRSSAIQHYREEHAMKSIFCYLCEKPILAHLSTDFEQHFHEMHPNSQMEFCFDEKTNARPQKIQNGNKRRKIFSTNEV